MHSTSKLMVSVLKDDAFKIYGLVEKKNALLEQLLSTNSIMSHHHRMLHKMFSEFLPHFTNYVAMLKAVEELWYAHDQLEAQRNPEENMN